MSTPTTPGAEPVGVADVRTPEQIEADLAATRERVGQHLQDLSEALSPSGLRSRASTQVRRIFLDEFGGIRPERVVAAGAVVAGLLWLAGMSRPRR